MGRAIVRNAVAAYLEAQNLPYVGQIYPARPTILEEQDYVIAMNNMAVSISRSGSSAVLVVNIPKSHRMRRADTGRGYVNDTNIHNTVLEVFFACPGGDAVAAQQDNDTLCDAIVNAVRADATFSTAGTKIWSGGEYKAGVDVVQSEPYTSDDGLTIFIPVVVKWESWEWVAGPSANQQDV